MEKEAGVCVVTGASSGIGNGIARFLASTGEYRIIATARRKDRLQELSGSGRDSAQGDMVDVQAGDLTSEGFQDQLTSHVFDTYGRCDYLFNCAGIIEVGAIGEFDMERFTTMLRLNIEATFRLTYLFLEQFKKQGSGHVVNISSILGTKVRPAAGGYAASKFAMEALSEALRMELSGSEIQVSCIEPGLVLTELHNSWEVHPKDAMGIHKPLVAENVVDAVRYIMEQPPHVRIPRLMILPKDHNI